jgi:hypothetical protein
MGGSGRVARARSCEVPRSAPFRPARSRRATWNPCPRPVVDDPGSTWSDFGPLGRADWVARPLLERSLVDGWCARSPPAGNTKCSECASPSVLRQGGTKVLAAGSWSGVGQLTVGIDRAGPGPPSLRRRGETAMPSLSSVRDQTGILIDPLLIESGVAAVVLPVASETRMLLYVMDIRYRVCPDGQVKLPWLGGPTVSEPVT